MCDFVISAFMLSYTITFFVMELNFFELQNGKKIFSTTKINNCVLGRCVCPKLKIFLSAEKFGFKRLLQDNQMQQISETMDNGLCKVRTRLGSGITNLS